MLQLMPLWYPYLKPDECQELAEAAPSRHQKPPQRLDYDRTWGPSDIAVMKKEFAALDTSGDGCIDLYVRFLVWCTCSIIIGYQHLIASHAKPHETVSKWY
jgi:hypothetical protein